MERSFKPLFAHFLGAAPGRLLFTAHSHHCWPDATRDAQIRCWQDAAERVDTKWEHIFGTVLPAAQRHVARILQLPDPASVAFAPNTHELLVKVLWSLPAGPPFKILTSDGEFHSFERQARRLEEAGQAHLTRVPLQPYATFAARLLAAARRDRFDLVYVSQVFFGSGFAPEAIAPLAAALPRETFVVVDGYHGFCALKTDWSQLAARCFYLSGGYKYAMAGEGVCFLHCPPGSGARPLLTGWFAGFADLEGTAPPPVVSYGEGGARFLGSTFDPVGLYRFNAVQDLWQREGIDVALIHRHVERLQQRFLDGLRTRGPDELRRAPLHPPPEFTARGNFLTFETPRAGAWYRALRARDVLTDYRGDRLRLGFGLYHDSEDVDELLVRLAAIGAPPA